MLDGDVYGLIQRFGFLGLAYNSEQVTEEEAQSYDILFDPKVAGKVGWFDWWAHMGPIGLYEGAKGSWWPAGELDPYDIDATQFQTMVDTVKSLKPATAGFYSIADLFGVFANGEIWIQPAGGGWTALLLEAEGHPVAASVPEQGAIQWTETLGIFKGAKNPEQAKEFIHYATRPPWPDADRHPARLPGGDPEHGGLGAHGGGAARLGGAPRSQRRAAEHPRPLRRRPDLDPQAARAADDRGMERRLDGVQGAVATAERAPPARDGARCDVSKEASNSCRHCHLAGR